MPGYVMVATLAAGTFVADTPFLQLATPATTGIEILSIDMGQELSEVSQQEVVTLRRRTTASTMGTAGVLSPLRPGSGASQLGVTTTTNAFGTNSVIGTAGAVLKRWAFNALNGLLYIPVPEERVVVGPSGFVTLQFATAPASATWCVTVTFMELD